MKIKFNFTNKKRRNEYTVYMSYPNSIDVVIIRAGQYTRDVGYNIVTTSYSVIIII